MTRRSQLLELLGRAPGKLADGLGYADRGVAEIEPFPFAAIVGQDEMKLALILAVVNPSVGGALLLGPRGTGKTTAVRSLADLLPNTRSSLCPSGCTEELLDQGGLDAICASCAQRVGYGEPLTAEQRVRIINLPLNARLEDVVGGIDERLALEQQQIRLQQGILAQSDGHVLYIDEVNMLDRAIADAILDAAAQGFYTVRRGPQRLSYRSRFLLVGSMNPEEGNLRPQLMDRFGLRAVVRGLADTDQRYRAYEHAVSYRNNPEAMAGLYAEATLALAAAVEQAQACLREVTIGPKARELGLGLIENLGIHSTRAEITLFEAARARAAADDRVDVDAEDIRAVARLSLRFRGGNALQDFFGHLHEEDARITSYLDGKQ